MSDDVVFRTSDISDAAVLSTTISAAFEQYRGCLVPESGALRETEASIAAELAEGARAILAERSGVIVGCVMTKRDGSDLYFGRLAVPPAARGAGVGVRLVAAVEAAGRQQGAAGVRLSVRIALPENQRLFAALGYAETGRGTHPGYDQPTFIHMRKAL